MGRLDDLSVGKTPVPSAVDIMGIEDKLEVWFLITDENSLSYLGFKTDTLLDVYDKFMFYKLPLLSF